MQKEIVADKNLVAFCGLYCGACKKYLAEKCSGCRDNIKATWCGVRKCGLEKNYGSCADCGTFKNVNDCPKFNNIFSKLFGLIFRSDRKACIERISEIGAEEFAKEMAVQKTHKIKRK